MKARNFEDIKDALPLKDRIGILKQSRPEPPVKRDPTPEEKLAKAIDGLGIVLSRALEKPLADADMNLAALTSILEALRGLKGSMKPAPQPSRLVITPVGGDRVGMAEQYIIERE
jgi:hypothetical protein